jgi:hypothetical protein
MTSLVPLPDDPVQRLRQARRLLKEFSGPNSDAVSAEEIRELARAEIKELLAQRRRSQQGQQAPNFRTSTPGSTDSSAP